MPPLVVVARVPPLPFRPVRRHLVPAAAWAAVVGLRAGGAAPPVFLVVRKVVGPPVVPVVRLYVRPVRLVYQVRVARLVDGGRRTVAQDERLPLARVVPARQPVKPAVGDGRTRLRRRVRVLRQTFWQKGQPVVDGKAGPAPATQIRQPVSGTERRLWWLQKKWLSARVKVEVGGVRRPAGKRGNYQPVDVRHCGGRPAKAKPKVRVGGGQQDAVWPAGVAVKMAERDGKVSGRPLVSDKAGGMRHTAGARAVVVLLAARAFCRVIAVPCAAGMAFVGFAATPSVPLAIVLRACFPPAVYLAVVQKAYPPADFCFACTIRKSAGLKLTLPRTARSCGPAAGKVLPFVPVVVPVRTALLAVVPDAYRPKAPTGFRP